MPTAPGRSAAGLTADDRWDHGRRGRSVAAPLIAVAPLGTSVVALMPAATTGASSSTDRRLSAKPATAGHEHEDERPGVLEFGIVERVEVAGRSPGIRGSARGHGEGQRHQPAEEGHRQRLQGERG